MNIYLVTRDEKHEVGWDQTNALVVAAASEVDIEDYPTDKRFCVVKLIGSASEGIEAGAILTDFNAG